MLVEIYITFYLWIIIVVYLLSLPIAHICRDKIKVVQNDSGVIKQYHRNFVYFVRYCDML